MMFRPNEFDDLLGPVQTPIAAPVSGGGEQAVVGGAFEGTAIRDTQLAMWQPKLRSADKDILPEKYMADARVRDTVGNDAYVAGGSVLRQDSIVGSIYALNAKPATKVLWGKEDEVWETEYQEEVEEKFTLYAESFDNWIDASRMNNMTGLVRLAVGVDLACGEALATAEWMRQPGRPFKTAIQMIEPERLCNPDGKPNTPTMRGGIERDFYNAPQFYNIRKAHQSDYYDSNAYKWARIPVRKPWGRLQVIHIFEQTRINQSRGMSSLVSALKELKITKQFRDVVLQNAVVNATYAASIESELPSEQVFAALGEKTDISKALNQIYGSYLSQVEQYATGVRGLTIDGVKIPHLLPGTKLQMRPAGKNGPLGTEFEQSLLRYIATALGVSYEQLSRDYTHTNYSSARAALSDTDKAMRARKRVTADRMATAIYRLWLEEAINAGALETLKRRNVPSYYEGQNAEAYSACDWIGASRGQIDELKETQAAVLRVREGLSTIEMESARLGQDWRKMKRQRKRELELDAALGLNAQTADTTKPNAGMSTTGTAAALFMDAKDDDPDRK